MVFGVRFWMPVQEFRCRHYSAVCRLGAVPFGIRPAAAAPATAEIEKFMRHCDGKLCASFRASITVPEGWVEDKEASRELGVQMLLPKGQSISKRRPPRSMRWCATTRTSSRSRPLRATPTGIGKSAPRTPRSSKLPDVARQNGKPAFERHQFEAPKLERAGVRDDRAGGRRRQGRQCLCRRALSFRQYARSVQGRRSRPICRS